MRLSGPPEARIAAVAARQRGRISARQLQSAGIGPGAIAHRVGRGSLHRLHRGVYAVGHTAAVPLGAETAALLAVPGAVLSHESAAGLYGWRVPEPATVHLLTTSGRRSPTGICVHRSRRLTRADVSRRDGLPVTSAARTLLDLADTLPDRALEIALDAALTSRVVRRRDLDRLLGRSPGRAATARLQRLLADRGGPTLTRSQAEERFLALVRRAGLETPEVNVPLLGFELDFLWREAGLAVEIDGFAFHGGRGSFEADRRKDATLQAAGIATMRITWRQLISEPEAVLVRLAQALVRRPARAAGARIG